MNRIKSIEGSINNNNILLENITYIIRKLNFLNQDEIYLSDLLKKREDFQYNEEFFENGLLHFFSFSDIKQEENISISNLKDVLLKISGYILKLDNSQLSNNYFNYYNTFLNVLYNCIFLYIDDLNCSISLVKDGVDEILDKGLKN